jgi:hypothetical protein
MSTLEVNKITPVDGGTNTTLGDSGDTIQVPSGVTLDIASGATLDATGATVSGITSTTINNNADNRVITGSGTANTLEGEANLTYDGSNLGVNIASPTLIAGTGMHLTSSGSDCRLHISNATVGNTASDGGYLFMGSDGTLGLLNSENADIRFYTNGTEKMRLRSNGYLGVTGTAGTGIERRLSVYGSHVSEDGLVWIQTSNGSGDDNLVLFFDGNTNNCGEITLNASANTVAYVTSSDYRLKQNATDIADGITRLKQLKPYRFQWKSDPDNTVDGFFAHEAQEIVPEAVTGTKDAMKTAENVVVNEDGSVECYNISQADWEQGKLDGKYASNSTWEATKEVIDRQGIDQAKLVPLLTAALKEAITKIETLETEMTALKARVQALESA